MIVGYVKGQELQLKSELVVADTIDYLTAKFVFKTADWQGLSKWAHFKKGSTVYDIPLTVDSIQKSDHLNLSEGAWEVYLHGNEFSGGEVVERITTEIIKLTVKGTGLLNGEPFPEIPASESEQIEAKLANHESRIEVLEAGSGGGGTSDFDDLTNRPKYNGSPMTHSTDIPEVKTAAWDAKQDEIGDLDTIRTGANLGATAVQPSAISDMATQTWVSGRGYITAGDIPVLSVNGKTGTVTLTAADLGLTAVFNLKGSKPTYTALPATGNVIGDVWYVVDESVGYIWLNDGTTNRWEQLGLSVDLSNYVTTEALAAVLNGYVAKVAGKGLSTNDYTTAEMTKLAGIAAGAEVNVQADWTQTDTSADDYIKNKPTIPSDAGDIAYDDDSYPSGTVGEAVNEIYTALETFDGYLPLDEDPPVSPANKLVTQSDLADKADKPNIKTVMDSVATVNTMYFLGTQSAVNITMPTTAQVGAKILVVFSSGATAATLTCDLTGFSYTPKANTTSWISFTRYNTSGDWLVEIKEG